MQEPAAITRTASSNVSPKKDEPSMLGRAWKNLKETFSDSPSVPANGPNPYAFQPRPNQGFLASQTQVNANQPRPNGKGLPNRGSPRVYAAPPAYRWYGWGTTTPGQNVYSPDGQSYPNGSARWFVRTGATPGAFPMVGPTAMTRLAGGAEPPHYVGAPSAPLNHTYPGTNVVGEVTESETPAKTVTPPPALVTTPKPTLPVVSVIPTTNPLSPEAPASEPVWRESSGVVPTVPVAPTPTVGRSEAPNRPTPPAEPQPAWQPARVPSVSVEVHPAPKVTLIPTAATEVEPTNPKRLPFAPQAETPAIPLPQGDPGWLPAKNFIPVDSTPLTVSTQTPISTPTGSLASPITIKPAAAAMSDNSLIELERTVREACRTTATVLEIVQTKPGKLTVKFVAESEMMAGEAVKMISQMSQLKPYAVEFEGKVLGN
jgi:hypothetical protein